MSMFGDNTLNQYSDSLQLLIGETAEDLLAQIKSIRVPVGIITIYPQGSKHYAWIQGDIKVVKRDSKTQNTNKKQNKKSNRR